MTVVTALTAQNTRGVRSFQVVDPTLVADQIDAISDDIRIDAVKSRGILFCSNPRGNNEKGFSGGRDGCFFDLDTWRNYVTAAGFFELQCYFRPTGLPCSRQPWLATVWRKGYSSACFIPC